MPKIRRKQLLLFDFDSLNNVRIVTTSNMSHYCLRKKYISHLQLCYETFIEIIFKNYVQIQICSYILLFQSLQSQTGQKYIQKFSEKSKCFLFWTKVYYLSIHLANEKFVCENIYKHNL